MSRIIATFGRPFRAVTQFHENETLVAVAQTAWGRAAVLAATGVLLFVPSPCQNAALLFLAVVLASLMPQHRRSALSLVAVAAAVILLFDHGGIEFSPWARLNDAAPQAPAVPSNFLPVAVALLACAGLFAGCMLAAQHFQKLPGVVRRYPQICLHLLLWACVATVWLMDGATGPMHTGWVMAVTAFLFLIWRCGYLLLSAKRGRAANTRLGDHLFYLWPFYGGSDPMPIGKGFDYFSQRQASAAEAFARAQLAGIKLLILARLWKVVLRIMDAAVYSRPDNPLTPLMQGYDLGLPMLVDLINGDVQVSVPVAWSVLYLELVRFTLSIAFFGHFIVGSIRLCGFNIFRNTYKPLLAESIVDFWNRFVYYFKEVLVEFFFFPCYLRYFKRHPRLRMFTAVFAAACVGNLYYHVLNSGLLVDADWSMMWVRLGPRILYCVLLALGVYLSMQRQQKQRGRVLLPTAPGVVDHLRRFGRIAGVWTFYSLIHIWNLRSGRVLTFTERNTFFLSLFGW